MVVVASQLVAVNTQAMVLAATVSVGGGEHPSDNNATANWLLPQLSYPHIVVQR